MPRKLHPFLHKRGRVFYFFRHDQYGSRREESLRTADEELAVQRYKQRKEEIRAGLAPQESAKARFDAFAAAWLDRRSLRVAKGTLKAESSIVRTLVRELGGNIKMEDLADIRKIYEFQDSRLRAGISAKTVNNDVQVLALILQDAELWHRVQPRYKPLKKPPTDVADALTPEQCAKLVTIATQADRFAVAPLAAVLALDTGMCGGEIKKLKLGDLHHDTPRPYLTVRRATTKTHAGARRVALGQLAVWAIRKLVVRARELGACTPTDYLFPTDLARHTRSTDPLRGTGYDPSHPQTSWQAEWLRFRKQIGIDNRRFHDLRHTYITRAAEAGVPIAVTRAQVGHLSEAMTRHYTHVGQTAQYEATRQIERHRPELLAVIGLAQKDATVEDRPELQLAVERAPNGRTKPTIN